MKYIICAIFSLYATVIYSATKRYEDTIRVNTTIDITHLYTGAITAVRLLPDQLDLKITSNNSGFENETVELTIETDIAADISGINPEIPYKVELVSNNTICMHQRFSHHVVDFSATQSVNPTFVTVGINKTGSGSTSHTYTGVGPTAGVATVADFAETYAVPGSAVDMKKNTHRLDLSFLPFSTIGAHMPTSSVLNTECNGELLFSITIGL